MISKRGIIVWMSTFVTFLFIMASFSMAVLLVNEGAGSIGVGVASVVVSVLVMFILSYA